MILNTLSRIVFTSRNLLCSIFIFTIVACTADNPEKDILHENDFELSKSAVRGAIVYKNYCVFCHGDTGDGSDQLTKIYQHATLSIKNNSAIYFEDIIRKGRTDLDRPPYMPRYNSELSDEQVMDVVSYLSDFKNDIKRGYAVYKTNCILCHGIKGNGKGRVSQMLNPPPSNLRHSNKKEDYVEKIIRLGGKAMGRSPNMPVWDDQLSDQEIKDVVLYLNAIKLRIAASK